jgi:hypothetical protein
LFKNNENENDVKKRFGRVRKLTTRGIYDNDRNKEGDGDDRSKKLNFIPLQEYIEFLRDMRDILNVHKDMLLMKVGMFYLSQPKS